MIISRCQGKGNMGCIVCLILKVRNAGQTCSLTDASLLSHDETSSLNGEAHLLAAELARVIWLSSGDFTISAVSYGCKVTYSSLQISLWRLSILTKIVDTVQDAGTIRSMSIGKVSSLPRLLSICSDYHKLTAARLTQYVMRTSNLVTTSLTETTLILCLF